MKKNKRCSLFVLLFLFIPPNLTFSGGSELFIIVKNVKQSKGKICIALHNSEESFRFARSGRDDSASRAYRRTRIKARIESVSWLIKDMPLGEFGITVFHDIDGNNKLNKFLGIPIEPYGFSNGGTNWNTCKFRFNGTVGKITIGLD
jgi:uncharacterized protein (DUF2141 family)